MIKTKFQKVMEPLNIFNMTQHYVDSETEFDWVMKVLEEGRATYFLERNTFTGFFDDNFFGYCSLKPKTFSQEQYFDGYCYRTWYHYGKMHIVCFHEGTYYVYESMKEFIHSVMLDDLNHGKLLSL